MSNYLGFEPTTESEYFFLSYSSLAVADISEIATFLASKGVPIWYDHGIEAASIWSETLKKRIEDSKAVLLFLTRDLLQRAGSYVTDELYIADYYGKKTFVIFVDEITKSDIRDECLNLWVRIQKSQNINIYNNDEIHDKAFGIMRAIQSYLSDDSKNNIPPLSKPRTREEEKIHSLLEKANTVLLKPNGYDDAKPIYTEVTELDLTNPFGWFGLAKVSTKNFSDYSSKTYEEAKVNALKALNLASEKEVGEIKALWDDYTLKFNAFQKDCKSQINNNNQRIQFLLAKNKELEDTINVYKYGKINFLTVLWFFAKILISVLVSVGTFAGLCYLSAIYVMPKFDWSLIDSSNYITYILFAVIAALIIFGLPIVTFCILCVKFVKRNISKKMKQKIKIAEKEQSDHKTTIESLNQENRKLRSMI